MLHWWRATGKDQVRTGWVKRFAPRLWTVDFPRPMMAALTAPEPGRLRCDLRFQRRCDLAGIIWASEDRWSHPLLGYATSRDYRGCVLSFEWLAGEGVQALDAVNGPVLTIEGRDPEGRARAWYVRLWNYARGTGRAARVRLEFDALAGGFMHPGEADPVWAGDIDRMFVSVVGVGHDGVDAPLDAPNDTWVEMHGIACEGAGSTLAIGDAFLPEHDVRMASGYDDSYHQPPERLAEQWEALGYRAIVNHYVGMSHYPALVWRDGGWLPNAAEPVCAPALAWHRALARACAERGWRLIVSLSFELLAQNAPAGWVQRDHAGRTGLTGWEPPSALLSPCHDGAVGWLGRVAAAFMTVVVDAGCLADFQVGEPWWWVGPDDVPCFYDAATRAAWAARGHGPAPVIADIKAAGPVDEPFLAWLGGRLAAATFAVRDAALAAAPGARSMLLFYAPQVLRASAPRLALANMPAAWARPAWDVLQLEDYTFVVSADEGGMARGRAAVERGLGYPRDGQHYLAGFVLRREDAVVEWPRVARAAVAAARAGVPEVFVWAWPQVARDGWTVFAMEDGMAAFDDVRFPLEPGFAAGGGPEFLTQVARLASGFEQRNAMWAQGRLRFDAGLGVRAESDLTALAAFFRARRGPLRAFRFRDPFDWRSGPAGAADEQWLGDGDGRRTGFALVKRYAADDTAPRRITRPVPGSVRVAVNGLAAAGWRLGELGMVVFDAPPAPGARVTAGFVFDVPMRFETDALHLSMSGWRAGEAPSVPLVEVREA